MDANTIKEYYNKGLFTADQLKIFVECGWITQEQYDEMVNG